MPDKTPSQGVRDLFEDHIGFWRPYWDAMTEEEAFLDGDRYEDDNQAYNRDRRLVQIRGQETQDTIRHIAAKATEKPRSVEARPIDMDDDPDAAEVAASLVEWELSNPWKGFEECYEAAIISCRERRLGVVWMDWDPDQPPYGEILYRFVDPRRIMWDPAYDPHHPLCGWLLEQRRLSPAWIHRNFKNSEWVQPDRDAFTASGEVRSDIPILRGANGERLPGASHHYRDNKSTIWFCWYKNDHAQQAPTEKPGSYEPIDDPEQRYLACKAECGYRSQTQGELRAVDALDQDELPEQLELACPRCAGNLERIDAKTADEYRLAYPRGKRLMVMAPFSAAPDDRPLYDGKWPISKARSFPGLFLTAYHKPGRPIGPSDTTLMWDQQIASDNLRTLAVQRVFEHRNYWVLPRVGINDYRGRRYNFREDQFNVMYRDGSQAMGPMDVQLINGTGLDPAWSVAFNATQAALTQFRPQLDIGPVEERSRNIPVGTIERQVAEAETSTAHFNRRKNRELGKFYGVVWDYIRATYTPARLSRLRIDGIDMLMNLSGDDLPNYDFVIADTPEFTGLDKARSEAFTALLQVAQTMPQFLDIFAELNNLPRSVVRKLEKRMQEAQEEAVTAAPAGIAGATPDAMLPPAPDGVEMLAGLNGGGGGGIPMRHDTKQGEIYDGGREGEGGDAWS